MDMNYFNNWKMLYEESDNLSLHVEMIREGKDIPSIKDIQTDDLKSVVGQDKAYHYDVDGSFELVVHAVRDNVVYVSLMERVSEYGWRNNAQKALTKEDPSFEKKLVYFGKDYGHIKIYVNEWK